LRREDKTLCMGGTHGVASQNDSPCWSLSYFEESFLLGGRTSEQYIVSPDCLIVNVSDETGNRVEQSTR
jgi:hypothetical protein